MGTPFDGEKTHDHAHKPQNPQKPHQTPTLWPLVPFDGEKTHDHAHKPQNPQKTTPNTYTMASRAIRWGKNPRPRPQTPKSPKNHTKHLHYGLSCHSMGKKPTTTPTNP